MSDEWPGGADRSSHSAHSQRDERCAPYDHSSLIAVIDIGALRGGAGARTCSTGSMEAVVIEQIGSACTSTGFFVAVGHGIDDEMTAAFDAAHRFFGLPLEAKERSAMVDNQGYAGIGSARSDSKEMLDIGRHGFARWPDVPRFRQVVERYQGAALLVAGDLLRTLAVTLDLDPTFFADRMHDPQCFLRMLRYPPVVEPSTPADVMTGQHTDYGAITLLATDGVPGLEVRLRDGTWTTVNAPAGSLVVNLGDMLARWTNDRYVSTPHRVVSNDANSATARYSIPFFVNPDPATEVACIPSCVTPAHPCRYEPVTAAEFLQSRIDGTVPC